MHFHSINNGKPQNTVNKMTRIKAIHVEVDQTTPVHLRRHIANIYSDQAAKFPLGIAMCMVPELHLASTLEEQINAGKLQALQEQFLIQTEPQKLYITPHMTHNLQQVYATLPTFTASSTHGNKPAKPLFHAVSPMKKGGISDQVPSPALHPGFKVIALIINLLPGLQLEIPSTTSTKDPKATTSDTQPSIQSTPQITSVSSHSPLQNRQLKRKVTHQDQQQNNIQTSGHHKSSPQAQDKASGSWFTAPGLLGSSVSPWQQNQQTHPPCPCINIMVSNYTQDQWLLAISRLFQNTAWDRWRYRNGIQQEQQDPTWTGACN